MWLVFWTGVKEFGTCDPSLAGVTLCYWQDVKVQEHTHKHTHTHWGLDTHGCERADSLKIVTEQVGLEGSSERGRKLRVAECLKQTVPNRWASVRKWSFSRYFCVYTRDDKVNTHTPSLCGFEWSDTVSVTLCMVEWCTQNLHRNGSISCGTSHATSAECYQYTTSMDINNTRYKSVMVWSGQRTGHRQRSQ